MYQAIKRHKTPLAVYKERLLAVADGIQDSHQRTVAVRACLVDMVRVGARRTLTLTLTLTRCSATSCTPPPPPLSPRCAKGTRSSPTAR